jgi:hypothetical protein
MSTPTTTTNAGVCGQSADSADNLRTRHPELIDYIEEARLPMKYHGNGTWNDNQLLASYALAVVHGGYHHLGKIKECGPRGVETSTHAGLSTFDDNLLTRIVLVAHRMGVRVEIGSSGPGMVKLIAHARYTNDDKNSPLNFYERHPSLDHLAKLCQDWKLPEIQPNTPGA